MSAADAQVRVCFVTKDARYRVTETPFAVPSHLSRYGLSQVINHLLDLETPTPFDFLVLPSGTSAPILADTPTQGGELLRVSLARHMSSRKLSSESVITLEYMPAMLPPDEDESTDMPDWVSALKAVFDANGAGAGAGAGGHPHAEYIASACYDGRLRLHAASSGEVVAESAGAAVAPVGGPGMEALKAVDACFVAPDVGSGGTGGGSELLLASGGLSHDVCLWRGYVPNASAGAGAGPASLAPRAIGTGHEASVCAIAIEPSQQLVLSTAWDGTALLWRDDEAEAYTEGKAEGEGEGEGESKSKSIKRRRTSPADAPKAPGSSLSSSSSQLRQLQPLGALAGHTQCVSAAAWLSPTRALTGSWDLSLRLWDVGGADAVCSAVLNGNKVVTCVAAPPFVVESERTSTPAPAIVSGHQDNTVRLWDARAGTNAMLKLKLSSHSLPVSALSWTDTSGVHLASASHDGTVKIWDTRSTVPLHTIQAHEGAKVLSVCHTGAALVSGGSDSKIRIFHSSTSAEGEQEGE